MSLPEEGENKPTEAKLQGYSAVLSIGSTRCKANLLGKDSRYQDVIDTMVFMYIGISNPFFFLQCRVNTGVFFFLFMSAVFALSGQTVMQNLPSAVQTLCETWNNIHTNEFPNIGSWVCMLLLQLSQ